MKISENDQFLPCWASPPGDTISELLAEKNLNLGHFANLLEITDDKAQALIEGRTILTPPLARLLEHHIGGSTAFWLNRESQYQQDKSRLRRERQSETEWLKEFPVGDMKKFGWISSSNPEVATEVLQFFGVTNISAWLEKYRDMVESVAFRTSQSFESEFGAVAAWIRQGERESEKIHCQSWTPSRFRKAFSEIRQITRKKDPAYFIPKLQAICAECGVAVVVLRAPSGCRASGATYFASPEKAILMLSFRYLSDDHFWFTFFHEAGHLLLHDRTAMFLEGTDSEEEEEEREANEFAANELIPVKFRETMLKLPVDGIAIIQFAREIGISPGIVVGQLQHYGRLQHKQLNNLKRRFSWCEDEQSPTKSSKLIG